MGLYQNKTKTHGHTTEERGTVKTQPQNGRETFQLYI